MFIKGIDLPGCSRDLDMVRQRKDTARSRVRSAWLLESGLVTMGPLHDEGVGHNSSPIEPCSSTSDAFRPCQILERGLVTVKCQGEAYLMRSSTRLLRVRLVESKCSTCGDGKQRDVICRLAESKILAWPERHLELQSHKPFTETSTSRFEKWYPFIIHPVSTYTYRQGEPQLSSTHLGAPRLTYREDGRRKEARRDREEAHCALQATSERQIHACR